MKEAKSTQSRMNKGLVSLVASAALALSLTPFAAFGDEATQPEGMVVPKVEIAEGSYAPAFQAAPEVDEATLNTRATDNEVKAVISAALDSYQPSISGLESYNISQDYFKYLFDEVVSNVKYWYVVQYKDLQYNSSNGRVVSVNIQYVTDSGNMPTYMNKVNAEIDKAMAWVQYGMSDDQKAQVLHDYLVRMVAYPNGIDVNGSYDPTDAMFNAYGALVNGSAVCQGYVSAYRVLLNAAGIDSIPVISDEMKHSWNLVNIGGAWYHVDVTWDDSLYTQFGGDLGFDVEAKIGNLHHDFFLRSDDFMKSTNNFTSMAHTGYSTTAVPQDFYLVHDKKDWPVYKGSLGSVYPTDTQAAAVEMYRLYNPNSGEHFYTASTVERTNLIRNGWNYENIAWYAPTSGDAVYRLYSGTDHHYTTSSVERDHLVSVGWTYEGVGWCTAGSDGVPLYRQYNPNVDPKAATNNSGSHNYTTNYGEHQTLVGLGWHDEGIGWYGVR